MDRDIDKERRSALRTVYILLAILGVFGVWNLYDELFIEPQRALERQQFLEDFASCYRTMDTLLAPAPRFALPEDLIVEADTPGGGGKFDQEVRKYLAQVGAWSEKWKAMIIECMEAKGHREEIRRHLN